MKADMMSWMIICLAICAPFFSTGAEAATILKRCNSNDDCKAFPCTSDFVLCVNHLCTCQVVKDSGSAVQNQNGQCSSRNDCAGIGCPWGTIECVDGKCKCVN
ncbi:unnamed protein product [Prunus armeniaca]|uniref:EB domain-containing protein n=1 Tax=Prunus armeniaca TaxID=36596 RepID=A0A6J5TNU7_PRUAR|nr:unnamed protein product [Prunus armeniaca]